MSNIPNASPKCFFTGIAAVLCLFGLLLVQLYILCEFRRVANEIEILTIIVQQVRRTAEQRPPLIPAHVHSPACGHIPLSHVHTPNCNH